MVQRRGPPGQTLTARQSAWYEKEGRGGIRESEVGVFEGLSRGK